MSWTLEKSSRQSVVAGQGHLRDEALKVYRVLREDVATDLYKLGGLVVAGYLMDEVIPSVECLSPSLEDGRTGSSSLPCFPRGPIISQGHSRDEALKVYRILREDVSTMNWAWHSSIALDGLFEYTPGYWEWAEDVLTPCSTNARFPVYL
ncbi:hypothetical protein LIER_26847 [Lithospermum erythrorhizon]|uniref:Uncharacterized protein n=1 Tax=Lithospermum erythrorhizon TaxID=34254 RepID=A0AAV3RCW0_LITER